MGYMVLAQTLLINLGEYLNTVIPILAALAGALVGALSAELRTILEVRRDARRITNKVLFNLLDLRHLVRFGHDEAVLRELAPLITAHPSFAGSETEVNEYLVTSPTMREAVAKLAHSFTDPAFAEQYRIAVDALASVDPLLAFQLSGRTALVRMQEQLTELLDLLRDHQPEEETAREDPLRQKMEGMVKDFVHVDALKSLEDDILAVAAKLGWLVRWRVKRVLQRTGNSPNEESQEQFARLMTAMTQHLESTNESPTGNAPSLPRSEGGNA